jgi:hypothetical protein
VASNTRPPGYYWYPGDWKRDTGVKISSFAARSVWREMIDLMHEGDPYGHLTVAGLAIDAEQLALLISAPPRTVKAALQELEKNKVFSRTAEGMIYSRRMVRDNEIRLARKAGGSKGGNPALKGKGDPPPEDNPEVGRKDNQEVNHQVNHTPNLSHARAPALALADSLSLSVSVSPSPPREALLEFVQAANKGLAEHEDPELRQPIARIFPGQNSAVEAAETLMATGIPRADIARLIRQTASTCKHDGAVNSLGYFVEAVRRQWRKENAPERSSDSRRKVSPQVAADAAKLMA